MNNKIKNDQNISYAYFGAGCFWGVEYYLRKLNGVRDVLCGYMGGHIINPTYEEVCYSNSGHIEVVEVLYDKNIISYDRLCRFFFEIHDFTQKNGQGPDIGSQYLSTIFYIDDIEKRTINKIIEILKSKKYDVATNIIEKNSIEFFKAEDYHQKYYIKNNSLPYCHTIKKIF